MRQINGDSLNNPRVKVIAGDGISYLNNSPELYDVIIDDCEVDVTKQPKPEQFKDRYELYLNNLINKLATSGVACITDPLTTYRNMTANDHRKLQGILLGAGSTSCLSPQGKFLFSKTPSFRAKWMQEQSEEELKYWEDKGCYVAYTLFDNKSLGPELYIYMSNSPFNYLSSCLTGQVLLR